jgi:ABC-type antimicrobial peptide transport system permease subunit
MNISDTIWMSVHNLWSRKGRSLLNLSGVVVSCVLLLLTLAGTRGGREGILDIMNASEQTKRFMIFGSHDRSAKVPDEALAVPDGVSEGRRERLLQQLEKEWRNKNAKRIRLTPEHMAELRSIEQVHSIVWQNPVQCRFEWVEKAFDNQTGVETDATEKAKPTSGSLIGIDPADVRTSNRLLLGEMISRDDQQGVMIDEVTAYKLGFRTDDDLTKLIGLELKISCSLGKAAANSATNLLAGIENLLSSETIGLLRRVTKQLDRTDLSDQEKTAIKNAMKLLPSSEPSIDSAKDRAPKTQSADTPDDVRIDAKGNRTLVRSGIVRGILKQPEDDDLFGFLQFTGVQRRANVYVHHHVTEEIYSRRVGFVDYWAVAGSVSAVADLPEAIERIESLGFRTRSALGIVEKVDKEVGKVRLAAGALALVILIVAAIGICNTMIVAVFERTTEFGIMKSLGAEDRHVLNLVLLEGLITGVIGAAVAVVTSYGVARLISQIARSWIEDRLNGRFDQAVFSFHPVDVVIVFVIAALMCILASLLPAWRAAKMNPIAAMKRT